MKEEGVTFSFGENWKDYVSTVGDAEVERAKKDIEGWLGAGFVRGKNILDVGSGSGLHSLAFHLLGVASLYSFDYDKSSVEATTALWERAGRPGNWEVTHGSILDSDFLSSLQKSRSFDIVYSWGVLHHTGSMWNAIGNAAQFVGPGGTFFLSLYKKGPNYQRDLALKRKYNGASQMGKKLMVWKRISRIMLRRLKRFQNPFGWNEKKERGMNVYHDVIDWLGGLPYEVASEDEVLRFFREKGMNLERIEAANEGGCSIYVITRPIFHR